MRSVNFPLRKAYLARLTGIVYNAIDIPAYYQMIPDDLNADNFVVFGPVTSNDLSTFNSSDTSTLMRVTVHSFKQKYNDGNAADSIAGDILSRIYPNPQAIIELDGTLQCVSTELVSDITLDYAVLNSKVYIDRILIFRHKIFHR